MGLVRRISGNVKDDLRSGKNVELYVLVALAATLIVLNVFGLSSSAVLASTTLAVLTLLGIALLGIRHEIERLAAAASWLTPLRSVAAQLFAPEDALDEIQRSIRDSRTVWLWGATLSKHIPILASLIGECMEQNGLRVKVLLIEEQVQAWRCDSS